MSLQWSGHHDHSDDIHTGHTETHSDDIETRTDGIPEATVIEVRSLTKRYGAHPAVDDLTFTAPAGRVTGFLGPNGAGKTTTFRCLLGLAEPTSGEALIDGHRYRELAAPRRQVGAVLESTGFHPTRRGRDHLRVLARSAGLDERRIDAVLAAVGLGDAAARPVGGYSLGMRQRLGLAGALLGDPPVVVLDEPANGLDPEGVRWVRQLLRVWADEGRTVLVSSHQLAEIAQVVDRVVIVRDGTAVVETELTRPSGVEALERLFLEAMGDTRSGPAASPAPTGAEAETETGAETDAEEVRP